MHSSLCVLLLQGDTAFASRVTQSPGGTSTIGDLLGGSAEATSSAEAGVAGDIPTAMQVG